MFYIQKKCLNFTYKNMDELFKIKRNITFDLEKRTKEGVKIEENVIILLVITYKGERINIYTGLRIDAIDWNNETRRAKEGCTNKQGLTSKKINNSLLKIENAIDEYFTRFELVEKKIPTNSQVKEYYREAIGLKEKVIKKTFFEVFDLFTETIGKESAWTYATSQKYATLKAHLLEFDSKLSFDSLTNKKFMKFIDFLQEDTDDKKGLRNTSTQKSLLIFKSFLKWSIEKKFHNNTECLLFKPKLKGSTEKDRPRKVIYLNWTELMHLTSLDIKAQFLAQVRDVFCFCCFTGLRYSDVKNLKKSDIKNNVIQLVTIKTSDPLTIQLNQYSSMILKKYKNIIFPNNKALPVISNQKMNDYLKDLGALAGFDSIETETYYKGNKRIEESYKKYDLICTHTGRRTFVCNALALGIQAETIMKWTGHSTYEAMKPYIAIAEELKRTEMDKFNK